ncbi:hypothetical protein FACS1894147_05290 [Spirochaetia bacterium]|nr:hypothetical protein FACS1894147_05290 [Spirochaetia bacterium]
MEKRNIFIFIIAGIFLALFFLSCDLLRDSPFAVEAWSPGNGYHSAVASLRPSVLFSHAANKVSAERAFSLTEDGTRRNGYFQWEGKRLIFYPSFPLEKNRDYVITVSTDAQDETGLSLDKTFEAVFTTRAGTLRPVVLSINPAFDGLVEFRRAIKIYFSAPVTVEACINNISFNPSVTGLWHLDDADKTAVFTPVEPWKMGTQYRITVSSGFIGADNLPLEKEFSSRFLTTLDAISPLLLHAWGIHTGGSIVELTPENLPEPLTENSWWESKTRLKLKFSKPVDTTVLQSRLSVEPSLSLIMETAPGFADEVIFRFGEAPVYGSRFIIRLNKGVSDAAGNESRFSSVFHAAVYGENSRPPSLRGIRLSLNAALQSFSTEDIFSDIDITNVEFPYEMVVPFWIELYFDTASGAAVDVFSVMNLFRVDTTNNALSFIPRTIHSENFTVTGKEAVWESCYRLEIRGTMTNKTNSGVVSFRLGSGIIDNFGNRNEREFRISFLK